MNFFTRLLGFISKNGSPPLEEPVLDQEEEVLSLNTGDVKDLRERLRKKAAEPIISPDERQRLEDELEQGTQELIGSSTAVCETLSIIDEELEKQEKSKAGNG